MNKIIRYIAQEFSASFPAGLQTIISLPFEEKYNPDEITIKKIFLGGMYNTAGGISIPVNNAFISIQKRYISNIGGDPALTESSLSFNYSGFPIELNLKPIIGTGSLLGNYLDVVIWLSNEAIYYTTGGSVVLQVGIEYEVEC